MKNLKKYVLEDSADKYRAERNKLINDIRDYCDRDFLAFMFMLQNALYQCRDGKNKEAKVLNKLIKVIDDWDAGKND